MPTAATSATLVPPYHNETARTARRTFSQYGTEEALAQLLTPFAGTLALYAHRLPPETAGVGVRVTRLLTPERDAFPVWRGEAELSGVSCDRDSFADGFRRILAAFPAGGCTVTTPNGSTVTFREVNLSANPADKDTRLAGLPALGANATLTFAIAIPTTVFAATDFGADEAAARETLRRHYEAVEPEVLTRTVAKHLNALALFGERAIRTGVLPDERDGLYLELVSAQPPERFEWRDFTFRLRGRDRDEAQLRDGFLRLHGQLPLPAAAVAAPNGSQVHFFSLAGTRSIHFRRIELHERYHLEADLELEVRLNCAASSWSSAALPPEATETTPEFPDDLVRFERAFTAWTAAALNLEVDSAIWRGGIPLEQSGVGVLVKGFSFQKLAASRIIHMELLVKHRERNAMLEQLARIQRLFPTYDVELALDAAVLPVRAILPSGAAFAFPREHGNQHHQAGLELRVIL